MAITPEKLEAVLADVYEGHALSKSLLKHGVNRQTFYEYKKKNLECEGKYASARESRIELLVEQIIEIADDASIDPNRARNMIAARQWYAGKLKPQTYGDRIDLNVTSTASITDALAAASARALAYRGPAIEVESQAVETISDESNQTTGSKPVDELNSKSRDDIDDLLK